MIELTDRGNNVAARFWAKVEVRGEDECWPWVAKAKTYWGYGVIRISPEYGNEGAHRVSYMLTNGGAIPKGMFVMHKCDNPACCNPAHLSLGTPLDNMRDMAEKGRRVNAPHIGENNGRAKLKLSDVEFIRRNDLSTSEIVKRYGINKATAYAVRSGRSWRIAA